MNAVITVTVPENQESVVPVYVKEVNFLETGNEGFGTLTTTHAILPGESKSFSVSEYQTLRIQTEKDTDL
jgi:hypothetical protein